MRLVCAPLTDFEVFGDEPPSALRFAPLFGCKTQIAIMNEIGVDVCWIRAQHHALAGTMDVVPILQPSSPYGSLVHEITILFIF